MAADARYLCGSWVYVLSSTHHTIKWSFRTSCWQHETITCRREPWCCRRGIRRWRNWAGRRYVCCRWLVWWRQHAFFSAVVRGCHGKWWNSIQADTRKRWSPECRKATCGWYHVTRARRHSYCSHMWLWYHYSRLRIRLTLVSSLRIL